MLNLVSIIFHWSFITYFQFKVKFKLSTFSPGHSSLLTTIKTN